MKKTVVIVGIILIFFSFVNLLNAAVTVYTDRTAWENALAASFSEETFDDASLNPGVSVVSSAGAVANGRWEDRLDSSDTTEFSFSSNLTAYGGNWDLSPGGAGMGIAITLGNGSTYIIPDEIPNTYSGEFWGFISDTPFASVLLKAGTQPGVAETFYLDNMVYSFSCIASIPTLNEWGMIILLLVLAVSAFIVIRRQQHAQF